ncbi:MAG: polymerase, partial [Opitutales bacterium]
MLHHKTKEEFSALLKDSEILEALGNSNNKQVKVARLPDGRILKLFRRKGFSFTSGLRKPYCLRFKENAEKLTLMGIPSVKVEEVFHLSHTFQSGVLYPELVGTILRTVLKNANTSSRALWIARFAQFTCSLHERGIYF